MITKTMRFVLELSIEADEEVTDHQLEEAICNDMGDMGVEIVIAIDREKGLYAYVEDYSFRRIED